MSLTLEEKTTVRQHTSALLSKLRLAVGIDKDTLTESVSAIDNWVDINQSSFNNSLPQLAQDNLSMEAKSLLLMMVLIGRTNLSFLSLLSRRE